MATFKIRDSQTGLLRDILTSGTFSLIATHIIEKGVTNVTLPAEYANRVSDLKVIVIQACEGRLDPVSNSLVTSDTYRLIKKPVIENGKVSWTNSNLGSSTPPIILIGVSLNA